jgi:hypothetical protein
MAEIVQRTRKEAFEIWIKALRSGKYKQGSGALRETHYSKYGKTHSYVYCCLGVLCDLAKKDGGPNWDYNYNDSTYMGDTGRLSDEMQQFMGISPKVQDKLISLNDDKNASFKEIAMYLEKNVMPKSIENNELEGNAN